MANGKGNFWLKEIDRENELEFVILCCRSQASGCDLEAWILPGQGSNLCRFVVNGKNVIDFDPHQVKVDFSGTPVLYPTPNRVRDGVLHYQGRSYPQVKHGCTVYEHGLVYNEPWNFAEPDVQRGATHLRTWIDFTPSSPLFGAFPFPHRLALDYLLNQAGISITYTITNHGDQAVPFGFGLHPYFQKLSGDGATQIELPAASVYETTPDLLPTGALQDVRGTAFDLRQPRPVGELDLDHVFTSIPPGKFARVHYTTLGFSIQLAASPDFTHLVLYSPPGEPFFCLENQTCSTDAHNLYQRGCLVESGLKFVPAGGVHSGTVSYTVIEP